MYLKTQSTNNRKCMNCNSKIENHAVKNGITPKKDDLSVCSFCGCISKFDNKLNLIKLSVAEAYKISAEEPNLMAIILQYQSAIKIRLRELNKSVLSIEEKNELLQKIS